jgi:hypothetical protein
MDRKIVFEYADFERLMAKIEAIDRKLDQQTKTPVQTENEVLSRTEAMRFLRKSKTWFQEKVSAGEILPTPHDKRLFYKKDLEAYLNGQTVGQGVGALLPDAKTRRRAAV